MFEKSFDNVVVKKVISEKRGACLEAINNQGEKIHMDFCGMNPALVPDGTNAYLFGNTLIFVTRWSDMTDDEKETVETCEIGLAIHPYEFVQFSIRIDNNWGDVFVNLHHCCSLFNDEEKPVERAVFIFADTHDEDYIISRDVLLPPFVQKYLQKCNKNSHSLHSVDEIKSYLELTAKADSQKDFSDYLYDLNWEKTKEFSRKARSCEPDNIPDGIYIEISGENEIINMYQHTYEPPEPEMTGEVKAYYNAARAGISEGQYNLGVCYETGDGIEQNYESAVYWYSKAAEAGHPKAQYNLGVCLYNGFGADVNYEEAAKLFRLSAQQGDMYAQYNLGVCYYMGYGVEQNSVKAAEWLTKAAEQGHPQAKAALGI